MADQTVIRAFARAAFETALSPWSRHLRTATARIAKSGEVPALDDPTTPMARKQALINNSLSADAPTEVRNFLYTLASQSKIGLLPDIVTSFDQLLAGATPREGATITSAVPLTDGERSQLETQLKRQYGQELNFDYQIDPALIGGIVVRVGDRVIDGSVSGKLAALKANLEIAR